MHRYADLVKGRLVLELTFISDGHRGLIDMGEKAICAAIGMMDRVELLRAYKFLPHEFVYMLISAIFSTGELMSALLDLCIERIDAWFKTVIALPAAQRAGRLEQINHVLQDALVRVNFEPHQRHLQRDLLAKVIGSHNAPKILCL